jgi:hypothetical protein
MKAAPVVLLSRVKIAQMGDDQPSVPDARLLGASMNCWNESAHGHFFLDLKESLLVAFHVPLDFLIVLPLILALPKHLSKLVLKP